MEDGRAPLSKRDLQVALDASLARVSALEEQIATRVREMEETKSEVDLIRQLLRVRGGGGRSGDTGTETLQAPAAPMHPVVREVVKELKEARRPLHISEIMDRLHGRGVRIPGQGKAANVIAHLSRDPLIVRPSRGIYGLAEWNLPAPAAPATRRRVRGRSKSGGASG
jgi:hypothetical protein